MKLDTHDADVRKLRLVGILPRQFQALRRLAFAIVIAVAGFLTCLCGSSLALAADYDMLILDGQIVDGSGGRIFNGNIAIVDGRIVGMGAVSGTADQVIDAKGRTVAPGFIDVHTHSEKITEFPEAENFIRMGVTTIITGNCGGSHLDVTKFFGEVEETKVTLNVATLIGHNSVRKKAMGGSFIRPPNREQLLAMTKMVDQAMRDGAVGLSTGLIYNPGSFSKTDEIIELARAASAHDGIYVSHMRSEGTGIMKALDEVFQIAREADIRAEVSHLKCSGPSAWGQSKAVLAVLNQARADGLEITHDCYSYIASSTGLRQMIPDAAQEGNRDDYRARIADPEKKASIIEQMNRMRERRGSDDYSYAVIAQFKADRSLTGLNIAEAAKIARGSDSLENQIELILDIEARGGGSGVYHSMNEDDLTTYLKHPSTMVASDGGPREFGVDLPHPRSYGNAARFLARYVRDQKLVSLEEGIRKLTSLPATTFRLDGRGVLEVGAHADIVVFDLEKVGDAATFEAPHQYSKGFDEVIVNGVSVISTGELTGERSGGPLRRAKR